MRLSVIGVAAALVVVAVLEWPFVPGQDADEIERTEYHVPPAPADDALTDDSLADRQQLPFDAALVDRRPVGWKSDWLLNASSAVTKLDVPAIKPDRELNLLFLHPSYAAAAGATAKESRVLPSVNMIDGKAKQFDDGLYAALDQAYYQGLKGTLHSHVELVRRIYEKVDSSSPATAYLAAGLELAGVTVPTADPKRKDLLLADFRADQISSKPIGFYTWNQTLESCFRFLRFFQKEFPSNELTIPEAIAQVLAKDPALLADYRKAAGFYARLTNPYACLSVADLPTEKPLDGLAFERICREKKVTHQAVALFPPSRSRESMLFEKLFPSGLPENADLMHELIRRIRSGEVLLQPGPESGWYDYQVYALETLLLPEKGEEHDKLLLTREYKKRMLEAFQALVTKHRETHVRQFKGVEASFPSWQEVTPRLRCEPCPSYYLRTARAYAFLATFLEAPIGKTALQELHGLKEDGKRPRDLYDELNWMRDLFYGVYLVSAEDIGLKPALTKNELADPERCYRHAAEWLLQAFADPDLAVDTRVAVPIVVDYNRGVTRLWLTLGVRVAKLDASYARPPSLKPAKGDDNWQVVGSSALDPTQYLIPVDEFAEVELPGLRVLTRKELRDVCNAAVTKEAIVRALSTSP
jgi:hypothetical protein